MVRRINVFAVAFLERKDAPRVRPRRARIRRNAPVPETSADPRHRPTSSRLDATHLNSDRTSRRWTPATRSGQLHLPRFPNRSDSRRDHDSMAIAADVRSRPFAIAAESGCRCPTGQVSIGMFDGIG